MLRVLHSADWRLGARLDQLEIVQSAFVRPLHPGRRLQILILTCHPHGRYQGIDQPLALGATS